MAHVDFEISGRGTLYVFHPLTPEASDWVAEHLRQCSAPRRHRRDRVALHRGAHRLATSDGPRSCDD
jgi:hypothetical protein